MEGHVQAEVVPSKRSQKKKAKLLNKILQQMEFYFGDSNLAKDKFMKERLEASPSGYVDVDLFLKFNKIRALTNNTQDIVDALVSSEIIEISADRKQLKRKKPVERRDFDDCTIYVEGLPPHTDQKYLRDVFSRFGTITHINIPHFKASGKIKSFAFVEFASPESVDSVRKHVKQSTESGESDSGEESDDLKDKRSSGKARRSQSHCKEHYSGKGKEGNRNSKKRKRTESENSEKTSAHRRSCDNEVPVKQPSEVNGKNEVTEPTRSASEQESCDERNEAKATRDSKTDAASPHKSSKKRKRKDSDNESVHKKVRMEQTPLETGETSKPQVHVSGSDGESKPTGSLTVSASKDKESVGTSASEVHDAVPSECAPEKPEVPDKDDNCQHATTDVSATMEGEASDTNCPSTSKKKKKRQRKRNKSHEQPVLRILTKAEWKILRNKYLTLQRAAMVNVKRLLRLGSQQAHALDEDHYEQEDESHYEQEDENHCEQNPVQENEAVSHEGHPKFQPGVIIKLKFSEPLESFEKLKGQLKACAGVCYVDGADGASEVYVRCNHPEAASTIAADTQFSELGDIKVVKGEEELAYWGKVELARVAKFGKGRMKRNKRGRDKLIARAAKMFEMNTHVHFDD